MEFGTPVSPRAAPSRHEKSLGVLTMKFVSLLQRADDGVLDLKVVSHTDPGALLRLLSQDFTVLYHHFPDSRCEQRAVSPRCAQSGALICGTGGLA